MSKSHRRAATRSLLAALLYFAGPCLTHGFTFSTTTTTSTSRPVATTTELQAASLPLLDTYAGGRGNNVGTWTRTARQHRIDRVLEQARDHQRRREGRAKGRTTANASVASALPSTTPKKQLAGRYEKATGTSAATASLPFSLPVLTAEQLDRLERNGEIVMEQSEMGLQGSGFVVQDIPGVSEGAVWKALLDFDGYRDMIHTVRSSRVHSTRTRAGELASDGAVYGTPSTTRASFDVSKFRLSISCIFNYQPQDHYMELSLDNALQNSALQTAKGYWYTQEVRNHNGTPTTRVWLLCDLTLSPFLPKFIVDRAAASAMPRASTWLRPAVEAQTASYY